MQIMKGVMYSKWERSFHKTYMILNIVFNILVKK